MTRLVQYITVFCCGGLVLQQNITKPDARLATQANASLSSSCDHEVVTSDLDLAL